MKLTRLLNVFFAIALAAGLLGGISLPAAAEGDIATADPNAAYVPGEVVVGFESAEGAAIPAEAQALAESVGAQVVSQDYNMALLSFNEGADVLALAAQLSATPGVKFAEPNYIYSIPEVVASSSDTAVLTEVTRSTESGDFTVPVDVLKTLKTVKKGSVVAAYPNDPYLWTWGWRYVNADIVSSNATPSAGVCVLDTGVDYTHPDLTAKIVKGLDYVNGDADPMDDNGHGTHVAGVIAAVANNGKGIAGVSTGKVVAVKVLNAQGSGTNYGVALGIYYCANRSDVRVLSLSLEGPYSSAVDSVVNYAVDGTRNKLVVTAAGNSNSPTAPYPAGLSIYYPNKVLAVGAVDNGDSTSFGCRAAYSNYGSWVSVVAPGTNIYSLLPWNSPFHLGFYDGFDPGYDSMSGTSMATPFAAAAAARDWGYLPGLSNEQVGSDVINLSSLGINANGSCWPSSMAGKRVVDVAALLDRGAAYTLLYNSTTGLPLTGATFQVYQGSYWAHPGTLKGSGTVGSTYSGYAEAINLPIGSNYWGWATKTGVTPSPQWVLWHTGAHSVYGGQWVYFGRGSIPNKDANFTVVMGWKNEGYDLSMLASLPQAPNPQDSSQPAKFMIGPDGYAFGQLEGDSTGSLVTFPFGIFNHEGGSAQHPMPMESVTISNRKAHSGLAANAALPYYPGTYYFFMADWSHPLVYSAPFTYVWKDGKMVNGAMSNCATDIYFWIPWSLSSGLSGSASLNFENICTNSWSYSVHSSERGSKGSGVTMKP